MFYNLIELTTYNIMDIFDIVENLLYKDLIEKINEDLIITIKIICEKYKDEMKTIENYSNILYILYILNLFYYLI